MKAIPLESARLLLKPLSTKHLSDAYVGWLNDPEVYKYLSSGGNYTLKMLEDYLQQQEKAQILFWAIHLKDSDKHIGNIKIDPIDKKNNSGEYGIMIGDRDSWGKGIAKEASLRVIEFCFTQAGLSKITLGVLENNVNAVALYKKMGFKVTERIEKAKDDQNSIRMQLSHE